MDIFISHASEDKEEVALPLCQLLKEVGLEGWLDREEICLGDSIPDRINQGLIQLSVGLVIASLRYFKKAWPQEELHTLLELELAGKIERIIPSWHQIDKEQILQRFPSLGHHWATHTDKGLEQVALNIVCATSAIMGLRASAVPVLIMVAEMTIQRTF